MPDYKTQPTTQDAKEAAHQLTQYLMDQGYLPSGFYPWCTPSTECGPYELKS